MKLDYEMKMLNMKNKEKDDQEAGKISFTERQIGLSKLMRS